MGEYDNGTAAGNGTTEYIWMPLQDGSAIPMGFYRGGQLYAVHTDDLGTPRLVSDDAKRPVWLWPYSAFGANKVTGPLLYVMREGAAGGGLKATPAVEFALRFPGQMQDADSGVFYNYFRDYAASHARYIQSDPMGQRGGSNIFTYASANPMTFTDPEGLKVWRRGNTWSDVPIGEGWNPQNIGSDSTCTAPPSYPQAPLPALTGPNLVPAETSRTYVIAGSTGAPANNQAQNSQVKAVVRILGLTPAQLEQLHREISGQNYSYQEILRIGGYIKQGQ